MLLLNIYSPTTELKISLLLTPPPPTLAGALQNRGLCTRINQDPALGPVICKHSSPTIYGVLASEGRSLRRAHPLAGTEAFLPTVYSMRCQ